MAVADATIGDVAAAGIRPIPTAGTILRPDNNVEDDVAEKVAAGRGRNEFGAILGFEGPVVLLVEVLRVEVVVVPDERFLSRKSNDGISLGSS